MEKEKASYITRSSAKAEYRAMELDMCELIWLRQLIQELKMRGVDTKTLIYDNQVSLHITSNAVFHEINCHVTGEKI